MKGIPKYTIGMGDRFAHQGKAQLEAVVEANVAGIELFPVWNKSFREHSIVGSEPQDLRNEADTAVSELSWDKDYFVDADHINLTTVEAFLPGSNFYTLDVADFVGQPPDENQLQSFLSASQSFLGNFSIPGIDERFEITEELLREVAGKFLVAIRKAKEIYCFIAEKRGADSFVTEVSIDETDTAQTPIELFLILKMIAAEEIPVQTIAPKFTGRFNKGVDYVGDLDQFEKEFDEDLYVIRYAVETFGLPQELKLSVHSGSDKFSLYPIIGRLIRKHEAGLHLKTAGTTWLEEVIGLAESEGQGLELAKEIYRGAFENFEELAAPYSTVIDIDPSQLPSPSQVDEWESETFVRTLRHNQKDSLYNPHVRQLIHIGFKIAAKIGEPFTDALVANEKIIARNVRDNLYDRHISKIFL